ncbi:hypothetical protein ACFP1Z_30450, partial [Streptomyces gamaensis]
TARRLLRVLRRRAGTPTPPPAGRTHTQPAGTPTGEPPQRSAEQTARIMGAFARGTRAGRSDGAGFSVAGLLPDGTEPDRAAPGPTGSDARARSFDQAPADDEGNPRA